MGLKRPSEEILLSFCCLLFISTFSHIEIIHMILFANFRGRDSECSIRPQMCIFGQLETASPFICTISPVLYYGFILMYKNQSDKCYRMYWPYLIGGASDKDTVKKSAKSFCTSSISLQNNKKRENVKKLAAAGRRRKNWRFKRKWCRGWQRTNGGSSCSWIADWQRLAEDKRRLIMQLDRWLTEAGRGQTEAHHAAGSLIDRGWLIHHLTLNISPQFLCQLVSIYGLWGKWNQYLVEMPKKQSQGWSGSHMGLLKKKIESKMWINLTILSAFSS